MPQFCYTAINPTGTILRGMAEAHNELLFKQDLHQQGYEVLSFQKTIPIFQGIWANSRAMSVEELRMLLQELLALLRAGLPVVKALELCTEQVDPRWRTKFIAIQREVSSGVALSEACGNHPDIFPPLCVATLQAGGSSGNLTESLRVYIQFLKRVQTVRSKVKAALVYPAALLAVSTGVLLFLLTYVVPTFSALYADYQTALPWSTDILLIIANLLRRHGFLLIALTGTGVFALSIWGKSKAGRLFKDQTLLNLPLIGAVVRLAIISQITRVLATALQGGLSLPDALVATQTAVPNSVVAEQFIVVQKKVREGISLSDAFQAVSFLPITMRQMVSVGEQSGSLEEMLTHIAEYAEERLDETLARLTGLLEPILIVGMGLLIGAIVISLYLPMFQLAQMTR